MTPKASTRRAVGSASYLILLRGGFALREPLSRSAGELLPRHFTNNQSRHQAQSTKRPPPACLFSVALSIAHDCHAPSALDKRILRPVESGLSSASRQRPVTRASLRKRLSKIGPQPLSRGRGCGRTSCRPRSPGACQPRRCGRWRRRAARRSAAAPGGNRRTRRHG